MSEPIINEEASPEVIVSASVSEALVNASENVVTVSGTTTVETVVIQSTDPGELVVNADVILSDSQVVVVSDQSSATVNATESFVTVTQGYTRLEDMKDVDVSARTDGSVLVYDQSLGKFVADSINTISNVTDGGNF